MTRLSDIGEDALIAKIVQLVPRDPSPAAGPGDDCAVVIAAASGDDLVLLKTDALVEGVHFTAEADPRSVGWKAAARVLSDIAAMGGRPRHFLVTVALPATTAVAWVEGLYHGIGDCLREFGGFLAGGETTAVPENSAAVVSIAATGMVRRSELVARSGARPGDWVLVTGTLGGSIRGKHLSFTPRLRESTWLVRHFKPTAMMDLSDGLAKDLPRLAAASGCGFHIDRDALPATAGCGPDEALGDGEDYELLFTLPPPLLDPLMAEWRDAFPDVPLTVVGQITGIAENPDSAATTGGWEHFRRS